MKLIVTENYEELSSVAANIVAKIIKKNPKVVIGFATGSTPVGMYRNLVKMHNERNLDFSEVISFNIDEYVGLEKINENSYYHFMHSNLFNYINIKKENIYIPNGMSKNITSELEAYQEKILRFGGIDIQIDGLGENGHIGFNEPNKSLKLKAHVTSLSESTITANSRLFKSIEEVPTKAITLGIGNILESKSILIIANGKHKAKAVKSLVECDEVTTQNPSTFLKLHPDVTVIVDKEAASLLR